MSNSDPLALGLDFGTESVRALLVDLNGNERAGVVVRFKHGQIIDTLPGSDERLPANFALQHPQDWLDAASRATRRAVKSARCSPTDVVGIGVDFTSCTMLPCLRDGTPLCQLDRFRQRPHAWPKLWKHHGAKKQTERINDIARRMRQPWLKRYGGIVGLEWLFPKILEVIEKDPAIHRASDLWLEAGDWFVWRLCGSDQPARSTCQAGYKACWSASTAHRRDRGYPSRAFLKRVAPALENIVDEKLLGAHAAPGEQVGELTSGMAKRFGLREGTPISAAIIDAHAGVPGAGVSGPDTLVMVLGTSSCHMLMSREEHLVPGVAGIVRDGILPGLVGYETGQAAVGDAFAWVSRAVGMDLDTLNTEASDVSPGAEGVRCLDWFNGCRTPLMDGSLTGSFTGLTLSSQPAQLYRAVLEATGFGLRWIVETLRDGSVPVKRFVATGGLPHLNPLLMHIYADILGKPITIHPSMHGPALGAAILGALAAGRARGGYNSATTAVRAMSASPTDMITVKPRRTNTKIYDTVYREYREMAVAAC